MISHRDARVLILAAFATRFGRQATRPEAQCVQAVGELESGYASYWHPPGVDSNNWGAIQGSGPAGAFQYVDTHPNPDGTSTQYATTFAKYHSMAEGAEYLVRTVYQIANRDKLVLPAATAGDTLGFSTGLHKTVYYEGYGATVQERIEHHHRAVLDACTAQAHSLGEPMPDGSEPPPLPAPSLRIGMSGDAVKAWQTALNVAGFTCPVDGDFGPTTRKLTQALQTKLGLIADGVVGAATQAALAKSTASTGAA